MQYQEGEYGQTCLEWKRITFYKDFPRNKTIELTRSSHQLHSGLPKMHSVHVLYCLQSGSVEPREKDKPHLNKDTKKWNVSPAPKLKKQKVKKRKSNNKRASFFITEGTLLNNVWTVTSCNFIRQRKISAKKVSIRYFKTCPMRICRLRIENWTKWKII